MSNDDSSVAGAGDAGAGGNDRVAAPAGAVGNPGSQAQSQPAQIPAQQNNGGSNVGGGTGSGAPEPGQGGGGTGEKDDKPKKRQRRPPTAAQTAARKKAAEERKRFRDRVNLIAAALEEEQGRVQESSGSTQQPASDQAEPSAATTSSAGSASAGGQELDQGGDDPAGDEMDVVADAPAAPRGRSKRDVYFGGRVRRTRGLHRVAGGFQQFLSGSAGDDNNVRLPSASAMRQQFNWARAPGTSLLDRMAVMNNRAIAHTNMRRSVRLPKYMDGL